MYSVESKHQEISVPQQTVIEPGYLKLALSASKPLQTQLDGCAVVHLAAGGCINTEDNQCVTYIVRELRTILIGQVVLLRCGTCTEVSISSRSLTFCICCTILSLTLR